MSCVSHNQGSLSPVNRHGLWLAFLFGTLAMGFIVSKSALLPSVDTYYHLKMARLLPHLGATDHFPWLHWTLFRDNYVSHHFGFQALLAPLVWMSERVTGDLVAGGKAAVMIAMGLTTACFYLLLRSRDVRFPLAWTCLLGCLPWQFWLRLAYVRAPILALPLLLLILWLFLRDRPVLIALSACLFVNIYFGVVVAALIPAALFAGRVATFTCDARFLRQVLWFVGGVAAGLAVNPYFPENLAFLKVQLFSTGLGATQELANEWQPFDAWFLMRMAAPLGAIWLTALVWRLRHGGRLDQAGLGLLLLNVALLVLTLKARRFVEYWPVFALLNAADMTRPAESGEGRGAWASSGLERRLAGVAVLLALVLSLPGLCLARQRVSPPHDYAAIRDAMRYLAGHSPARSLVFTDDWDVFPLCFYWNDHNCYAVGLDPMFTILPYPELWERYRLITRGQTPTVLDAGGAVTGVPRRVTLGDIGDVFGARYVLVLRDHPRFYRKLRAQPERFERIYPGGLSRDSDVQPVASVFQVLSTRSDSPAATFPAAP
jgi:hypothetical protein